MKIDRTILVYVGVACLLLCGAFGLGVFVYEQLKPAPPIAPEAIEVPGAVVHQTLQEELVALTAKDPVKAFARFRQALLDDPEVYNECHGIAHQMGHEAYEQFGFDGAMRYQDALCGGGYIHGVVEGRFGLLHETDIEALLPTLCSDGNTSCVHGLGHGLMIATYLDIPTSLKFCDTLPESERSDCYDGVWMHIFDLEESGAHDFSQGPQEVTQEDIETAAARCFQTDVKYKTNCYFYLPRILAHHEEIPFSRYRDICTHVETNYRATCAAGSGHSVMKYNIAHPNDALASCSTYESSDMTQACKEGSMIYYLFASGLSAVQEPSALGHQPKCDIFAAEPDRKLCDKVDLYRSAI